METPILISLATPEYLILRNSLSPSQLKLMRNHALLIAQNLLLMLNQDTLNDIKECGTDNLVLFNGLGREIRNAFGLWNPSHPITNIWQACNENYPLSTIGALFFEDNVSSVRTEASTDDHPCHPDNFSQSCIVALHKLLQE